MSNVFTADQLKNHMETAFAPFVFQINERTSYTFSHPLRLPADVRKKVQDILDSMSDTEELDEATLLSSMQTLVTLVVTKPEGLVKYLGDDVLMYKVLLEKWVETTQAGEA